MSALRIKVLSDIHSNHHRDGGKSFVRSISAENVDVLVLAGDVERLETTLPLFCNRFKEVVFVLGNHEYYGKSKEQAWILLETLEERYKNLHWLDNKIATIGNQRFVGTTLWFPDDPKNPLYEHLLNDFAYIKNFREWVYKENKEAQQFLRSNVKHSDIVITHHLPSYSCVHQSYVGSNLNRFFVCPMDDVILNFEPIYWIAGHTHSSIDKTIEKTKIVVNPFGYARRAENNKFDENLILEV